MPTKTQTGVGPVDTSHSPYAHWKTLEFKEVSINKGFWSFRRAINCKNSLRHAYNMLEKKGNFHNLRLAAGMVEGEYRGRNFIDSDVYKWLEAMGWELGNGPDAELQSMADKAIGLVAAAQRPDGYINSYYQTAEPQARWADLDHGHEMYCAGHLFQAAVAFHRAAGDDRLLEIACRFADHICATFGPDKRQGACGHPEIEMALVELYRASGQRRYLDQASYFIGQRGQRKMAGYGPYGPEYHQDHLPVRQVSEAVGHAVRQLYLASGVTDLYLETGEQALLDAMRRLSEDIVATKQYITGGMGARFDGEAFGDPYELPSDRCYCETCAAIASLMWNWRMLLASGESKYADQMERALYNSILASPALDGRHFFYSNPLMLRQAKNLILSSNPPLDGAVAASQRPEWHGVACCPPNVMRLLASLGSYLASQDKSGLQIHHYATADICCDLQAQGRSLTTGQHIGLHMSTDYPWQGQVRIEVTGTGDTPWALSLRLPAWSQKAQISVNGQALAGDALTVEKGYAVLERVWQLGDMVELDLQMQPLLIASNPRVDATRASLAIQRGPIVYCLEDIDQEQPGRLLDVAIDARQPLDMRWRGDLLGGVMVIEAAGGLLDLSGWGGRLYQPAAFVEHAGIQPIRLVAVPYYAWGNRGIGGMRVWIPQLV
ncbi:MAG: glycoside hydrolase family 127 protein [Anaerolineaceae bacterium]|nr:glycoside hydrolase family 127 protein [Anaerolineaceae bacterium]